MPYDSKGHVTGTAAQRKAYDLKHRRKVNKKSAPGNSQYNRQQAPDTSPGRPVTPLPEVKRRTPTPMPSPISRSPSPTPTSSPRQRDFQPYAAGKPVYGGGRSAPNVGPVSGKEGYAERDRTQEVYKTRALNMLKKRRSNG